MFSSPCVAHQGNTIHPNFVVSNYPINVTGHKLKAGRELPDQLVRPRRASAICLRSRTTSQYTSPSARKQSHGTNKQTISIHAEWVPTSMEPLLGRLPLGPCRRRTCKLTITFHQALCDVTRVGEKVSNSCNLKQHKSLNFCNKNTNQCRRAPCPSAGGDLGSRIYWGLFGGDCFSNISEIFLPKGHGSTIFKTRTPACGGMRSVQRLWKEKFQNPR